MNTLSARWSDQSLPLEPEKTPRNTLPGRQSPPAALGFHTIDGEPVPWGAPWGGAASGNGGARPKGGTTKGAAGASSTGMEELAVLRINAIGYDRSSQSGSHGMHAALAAAALAAGAAAGASAGAAGGASTPPRTPCAFV